jgi:hypothetical protein
MNFIPFQKDLKKSSLTTKMIRRWSSPSSVMEDIAEVTDVKTISERVSVKQQLRANVWKETSVQILTAHERSPMNEPIAGNEKAKETTNITDNLQQNISYYFYALVIYYRNA